MKTKIILVLFLLIVSKGYMQSGYDQDFGNAGLFVQGDIVYGSTVNLVFQGENKIIGMSFYQDQTTYNYFRTIYRINLDGTLDPSFGNNGVFTDIPTILSNRPGSLIVTDDAIYSISSPKLPGSSRRELTVIKLTIDGVLDSNFGNGGYATIPEPLDTDYTDGLDLAVNSNNEIIAGGIAKMESGERKILVAKFSLNGSLVSSFGDNGIYLQEDIAGFGQGFARLLINDDDSICIMGTFQNNTTYSSLLAVVKLTSNGSLDTTFADAGLYTIDYEGDKQASNAFLMADGSILIFGLDRDAGNNYKGMSTKISAEGLLDTSYGVNGYGNGYFGGTQQVVNYGDVILKDNKYVFIGDVLFLNGFFRQIIVTRLNLDGTFDTSYGDNGTILFGSPSTDYTGIKANRAISKDSDYYLCGEVSLIDNKIKPVIVKLTDTDLSIADQNSSIGEIRLFPNPLDVTSVLQIKSVENNTAEFSIVNVLGQKLSSRKINLQSGVNTISLQNDIQNLSKGIYFMNFSIGQNNVNSIKFIR